MRLLPSIQPALTVAAMSAIFLGAAAKNFAQQVITTPSGEQIIVQGDMPMAVDPAAQRAMAEQMRAAQAAGGPGKGRPGGKGEEEKKPDKEGEKGGESSGEEEKGPLENVKRSAEPPSAPDPSEFEIAADEEGRFPIHFRNQPWLELLRWYARSCNISFDWQELPGDYINLSSRRPVNLEEIGDMINRALLMRGFTMLQDDESLLVAKVEGLNPALVPRVAPSQLSSLPPHKYVRTSFSLSWLLAEEVHGEFESMISKNGKLTPLQSTNRLEGMDAAANLRDIYDILEQEQSALAMQNLAKEFPLQYARASAVKEQLEAFLGIRSSGGGGGSMSSSAARMIQQQMQQMQQQMQQAARNNQGKGGASARKRPDDVYLVANERNNSVIVHAPPNKMAIIAAFITRVDVQNANGADYQRMNTRMKVFRLASLGPSELVASLNAMDVLEPATRLQVDENNNAIIAYASLADQYLIQSVIERLDGSERSFQVITLRRLDAESVAGSIKFLMGAEEEDQDNNNRSRYYGFYDPWSSRNNNSNRKKDKMRVGANVQDNQLLLWVNEIELEEVNNLLQKLGELPPAGGNRSTMRVIDASRQPETYEYLKRLKEQWDRVSPNPLVIPDASEFALPETDEPKETDAEDEKEDAQSTEEPAEDQPEVTNQPANEKITSAPLQNSRMPVRLVSKPQTGTLAGQDTEEQTTAPANKVQDTESVQGTIAGGGLADDPADSELSNLQRAQLEGQSAPVRIVVDESGKLMIISDDTTALDRLEQIMQTNRPPKKPYDVFKVKYARASWVALNLKDYFDQDEDSNRPRFFSFFFDEMQKQDEDRQLGDRPPLRFISDNDTNSIVVQGADDLDRKTIKELIELWDVPEPTDDESIRYTDLVRIRYSRADAIVTTLKEAYRDLLSANDKAFQAEQGGGDGESKRSGNGGGTVQGGGLSFGGFKGKLALGADTVTNTIIVSAEGKALLELIIDMIEQLDEAAKDEGYVGVYKVEGGLSGKSLEKALKAVFQKAAQNNQQKQQQQNQNAEGQAAEQAAAQQAIQAEAFRGGGGRSRRPNR